MIPIRVGSLTVVGLVVASGCGVVEDGAPLREEDTTFVEREERRTSERLALRTDTLPGGARYLTDGSGRALYLVRESEEPGLCVEACAEQWPPFTVSAGSPAVDDAGLDPGLVGSVDREGERAQITYGGHLLHFYHADRDPGDTKGHGVRDPWGVWHLIGPDGEPVPTPEEASGGAPPPVRDAGPEPGPPAPGDDDGGAQRHSPVPASSKSSDTATNSQR